jgi:hypothetical protein
LTHKPSNAPANGPASYKNPSANARAAAFRIRVGTVLRGAPVLATILPHDSRSVAVDNAGAKTKVRRELEKTAPEGRGRV